MLWMSLKKRWVRVNFTNFVITLMNIQKKKTLFVEVALEKSVERARDRHSNRKDAYAKVFLQRNNYVIYADSIAE